VAGKAVFVLCSVNVRCKELSGCVGVGETVTGTERGSWRMIARGEKNHFE